MMTLLTQLPGFHNIADRYIAAESSDKLSAIPCMFTIRRVNIYDSQILAVTFDSPNGEEKTCYIMIDGGAGTSLILKRKARQLGLKVLPTLHWAVQVDGETDLLVQGEIHTEFRRNYQNR